MSSSPRCSVCFSETLFDSSFNDIRLYRCPVCRHCFTDVLNIESNEVYSEEYFTDIHENWFLNPDYVLFESIYSAIKKHKSNARVLDVGCGNGNLLRFLRTKDATLSLFGIDFLPASPTEGVQFYNGDFMTWSFEEGFDVIVNLQVIEHIQDVRAYVARLTQLTCNGGLIITNTIDEESLVFRIARFLRIFGYRQAFERLYSRHHLNHFNVSSLKTLMERSGLAIVKEVRHNCPVVAIDVPRSSAVATAAMKAGVWTIFALGKLVRKPTYQTIFCRKVAIS